MPVKLIPCEVLYTMLGLLTEETPSRSIPQPLQDTFTLLGRCQMNVNLKQSRES
jgi:hypothetical protein